jgi:hypothetical protein
MRWFGLFASVILLVSLASCAETAGREYAYRPGYGYGFGPEAFCCEPRFERFRHFDHFHRFNHFHFHDHGGFHFHNGFHGGHHR